MREKPKSGMKAFLPLIVFLVLYVGCGLTFTLMGAENPFSRFPRHVALLFGIASMLFLATCVTIHFGLLRTKEERGSR